MSNLGTEDYSANLGALGRFKPGTISGTGGDESTVSLTANIAGTPIRFTLNESLDNLVSSATLTMLNAILGDEGQVTGVMGNLQSEDDAAKFGISNATGAIEPNTRVTVVESGAGLGTCTSEWRCVSVTSYLDENNVPYYEVQLEGLGALLLESKLDISRFGVSGDAVCVVQKDYRDAPLAALQTTTDIFGYTLPIEVNPASSSIVYVVDNVGSYLEPFFAQCGLAGSAEITIAPLSRVYSKGEGVWQIIEDILSINGLAARVNLQGRLIISSIKT